MVWLGLVMLLALAAEPPAQAASGDVDREVAHLIQFTQQSGCRFYRNGSWYPGEKAGQHMRLKYDYLEQRGQITRTEDFITKAASRSSVSGQEYRVRCSNGADLSTSTWLKNELARYRALLPATIPAVP
jgi:hypothetical protein